MRYSLELWIQLGMSFLSSFPPLLFFFPQLCVKPPHTTTLPLCISFSLGWFWSLPPVQYYKTLSIVLQALCPPDLISWSHLSLPLYSNKGCDLGHTWIVVFPTFFNLRLNFALRGSWSQPQSTPGIVFADYIEFLHFSCKVHINQISVLTIWWCPSAVQSSLVLLEEGVC